MLKGQSRAQCAIRTKLLSPTVEYILLMTTVFGKHKNDLPLITQNQYFPLDVE